MKRISVLLATMILGILMANAGQVRPKTYTVASPDGSLKAIVTTDSVIRLELFRMGISLLSTDPLGLLLEDGTLVGKNPVVKKTEMRNEDRMIRPEIREKSEMIRDCYQELKLMFKPDYSLEIRMYDEGLAYRFVLARPGNLVVKHELAGYRFDPQDSVCLAFENNFYTAYETPYVYTTIGKTEPGSKFYLPILIHKPDGTGIWLGESNIRDYPGMWLEKSGLNAVKSLFPGYPLKVKGEGSP